MSEFDVTVFCVKQKCRCGQEWEQTLSIRRNETFDLTLSTPTDEEILKLLRKGLEGIASKGAMTEEATMIFLFLKQVELLQGIFTIVEDMQMTLNSLLTNSNDAWDKRNNT